MSSIIGEILPLALGIAISPIPIIAAILMLLSPSARVTSIGFLFGWVLGIVLATTVFTLLAAVIPSERGDSPAPIVGIIQLALGVLLLLLALRNWRQRPRSGDDAPLPAWMKAIDSVSFPAAFGLGLLLSGLNPKNLLLAAGAGTGIGSAGLAAGETVLAVAVFTLLAASTVLVPVVGYAFAAERLRSTLDALRGFLQRENSVIMAVLLLLLGVTLIGKGIGSF